MLEEPKKMGSLQMPFVEKPMCAPRNCGSRDDVKSRSLTLRNMLVDKSIFVTDESS